MALIANNAPSTTSDIYRRRVSCEFLYKFSVLSFAAAVTVLFYHLLTKIYIFYSKPLTRRPMTLPTPHLVERYGRQFTHYSWKGGLAWSRVTRCILHYCRLARTLTINAEQRTSSLTPDAQIQSFTVPLQLDLTELAADPYIRDRKDAQATLVRWENRLCILVSTKSQLR